MKPAKHSVESYFISHYDSWDEVSDWCIVLHDAVLKEDFGELKKGTKCEFCINFENCTISAEAREVEVSRYWKPVVIDF